MAKHRRTRPVNPAHPGAAVFAALWGCVALPALVVGGFALGGVTPQWPTPVPTPVAVQAPCGGDASCAQWEADRAALHGVDLAVDPASPEVTPLFDPATGRVSCTDPASPLVDEGAGLACAP